jgi:hypothetical protein
VDDAERRSTLNTGEVRTERRVIIDVPLLPPLDCEMCRVFALATGAGAVALLAGWTAIGQGALVFGLLLLWLSAQLAAAPCCEEEADDG